MDSQDTENIGDWVEDTGFLVNPTPTVMREIAHNFSSDGGCLKVLVKESTLRGVEREFTVGSRLKQLSNVDDVQFKRLEQEFQSNLFVSSSVIGSFIDFNELTFAIGSDKNKLINDTMSVVESLWDDCEQISVRMSSFDIVKKTFTNSFTDGDVFFERFVDAVSEMEFVGLTHLSEKQSIDLFRDRWCVHAGILIAGAVSQTEFKQLGLCVEQCGVSSKSSLSRVKEELVEHGFITTSTVDSDIGRPGVRLEVAGLHTGSDATMLAEKAYHNVKIVDG